MTLITWEESVPSDSSRAGDSAHIRSIWENVAAWAGTSLQWPGSGGGDSQQSAGWPRAGAPRTFAAPASLASTPAAVGNDYNGRLYFESDTSRLLLWTASGTTFVVGSRRGIHGPSGHAGDVTWVWQEGIRIAHRTDDAAVGTAFPSAYNGVPLVLLSASSSSLIVGVSSVTQGGFTSTISYFGPGAASDCTIFWSSLGTMSFAGQG